MVSMAPSLEAQSYAFNVYWKRKGDRKGSNAAYMSTSVFKLLKLLEQAEGITRDNVETLIVHQQVGNGHTREVLAIEGGKGEEKAKPRLHLVSESPKEPIGVPIKQGFNYVAYPAQSLEEEEDGNAS